jgi:hypothetical protein
MPLPQMPIVIQRTVFEPEAGKFQYRVQFKPGLEQEEISATVPLEVAFSLSENGELADVSFMVPKTIRSEQALTFLRKEESAKVISSRVFIAVPGTNGDSVLKASGELELDVSGRIVSMSIDSSMGQS